jgi:hypothetical protein
MKMRAEAQTAIGGVEETGRMFSTHGAPPGSWCLRPVASGAV